jgi:hypothetical protein
LNADATYEFRIRAERETLSPSNEWAEIDSPWSEIYMLNLADAPKLSLVSAKRTGVTLEWAAIPDATSYDIVSGPQDLASFYGASGGALVIGDGPPPADEVFAYYTTYPPFILPPDVGFEQTLTRSLPDSATSFTDTEITPGTHYAYMVVAHTDTRTLRSNVVPVYVPTTDAAPATPQDFKGTRSGSTVHLSWKDAQSEASYTLWKASDDQSQWALLATLPADTTSYDDPGNDPGKVYHYRLSATNDSGESDFAETVVAAVQPPPSVTPTPVPAPPDTKPPVVVIFGPATRNAISPVFLLFGTARDNRQVTAVEYAPAKHASHYRAVNGTSRWAVQLNLRAGRNEILVRARDAAGNTSDIKRIVINRRK